MSNVMLQIVTKSEAWKNLISVIGHIYVRLDPPWPMHPLRIGRVIRKYRLINTFVLANYLILLDK